MAGSLENRGKLRELIDKFQFLKLRNRNFHDRGDHNEKDISNWWNNFCK